MTSGQTDSNRINKPFRYVDGKDSFSVFKLQDERNIAFKLTELKDCQNDNKELTQIATNVIKGADSLIASKDNVIKIQQEEKTNLIDQVATSEAVVSTYKGEVKAKDKIIKVLQIQKKILGTIVLALAATSVYLLLKP